MGTVEVAISVDADYVAGRLGSYGGEDSAADLSRGLAAGNEGIPRMVALFDEQDIETSWYVPGHTVETFRDEIETVAADGHELGAHGYSKNPTDLSRAQEDEIDQDGNYDVDITPGDDEFEPVEEELSFTGPTDETFTLESPEDEENGEAENDEEGGEN